MKFDPIVNLCVDACRGRVANYDAKNAHYVDEAVRKEFEAILGGEGLNYRTWRRHQIDFYEIIERTLDEVLPDAWNTSPFYNQFVEVRNGALGDKNEFVVEAPSTLIVSRFSGNHWDIDRQKLPGRKSFSVETEWFAVRVYDDLERFLRGTITLDTMFRKMRESFQKYIDSSIYTAFVGASAYLPAKFVVDDQFDKTQMITLCQRVATANNSSVVIAGTAVGLSKMDEKTDAYWISEKMKDEMQTTGRLSMWNGYTRIEIPQTFRQGTYDFEVTDDDLLVLSENDRMIKLFYEGSTRARNLNSQDTNDQTLDTQVQSKLGIGVVFQGVFGKYVVET